MLEINLTNLCQELGIPSNYLITRKLGDQMYQSLYQQLINQPQGQAVKLIFPPDQLMDTSFADEAILRLEQEYLDQKLGDGTLILQGLTEDSIHNINAAIHLQRLKMAFLILTPDGCWDIIGQLEQSLSDTLKLVADNRHLTAPELSQMLSLAINSASNRLKRLYDLRLVRREFEITDNGLQYIYYFWIDTASLS
jgi:DNA-binding transcriptional ArsR family regulator